MRLDQGNPKGLRRVHRQVAGAVADLAGEDNHCVGGPDLGAEVGLVLEEDLQLVARHSRFAAIVLFQALHSAD
jgi:hypothetical protein